MRLEVSLNCAIPPELPPRSTQVNNEIKINVFDSILLFL